MQVSANYDIYQLLATKTGCKKDVNQPEISTK